MLTKQDFKSQIVDGIKAGRLDACTGVEFGEIYTDLPQYYWCVAGDQDQSGFHFGVSISDIEGYTEKDFGELSDDDIKQAMLDIIDERGTDDWYDQYQEA
ncbi:hypothetical protein [Lactobacillus delbrueckii]|uniref:hypothetical protein n=1 Tax=Lactobacillus delbrueckii TaxID=1584 RepID=UPI0025AFF31D|nr:hypothetical protein [Lactobacillus delbrueckii]